jgi:hypothetical protein
MRIRHSLALSALAICVALSPAPASAQSVGISINLGPPRVVSVYEPAYYGPWRTSYMDWEPVTLYFVDGVYYERPAPRARTVVVYRRGREYFLPPRETAWVGVDRRFDYRHAPRQWDYDHGKRHGNGRGHGKR